MIQSLKGWNRLSEVSQLAVVVVFKDVAVVFLGPVNKGISSCNRHYRSRWKLVAWVYVDYAPHVGRELFQNDSVFINGNIQNCKAVLLENFPYRTVARVLCCSVCDFHFLEDPAQVACQLLGTCTDHDLVRGTLNTSALKKIFCYFVPEGRLALNVSCDPEKVLVLVEDLVHALLPPAEFKTFLIIEKGYLISHMRSLWRQKLIQCHPPFLFRIVLGFRCNRAPHIVSGLWSAFYISFYKQLVVRFLHCRYADSVLVRETSQRRKPASRLNAACENAVLHLIVDLLVQAFTCCVIQV